MKRTFVELPIFQKRWDELGLNDKDLRNLQEKLLDDPKIGAVMQGTGGVRKMRFAFEHHGKTAVWEWYMWILRCTKKFILSPHILKAKRKILPKRKETKFMTWLIFWRNNWKKTANKNNYYSKKEVAKMAFIWWH